MNKLLALLLLAAVGRAQTLLQQNYDIRSYAFVKTNGASASGNLSASGSGKVITLTKMPFGLDTGNYVYISGGSGTAEAVAMSAVSGAGGAASGTITVTTTHTHTGAWTVSSANSGITEASKTANLAGGGTVSVPPGTNAVYGPAFLYSNVRIRCEQGASIKLAAGAWVNFTVDSAVPGWAMIGAYTTGIHDVTIDSCEIDGNSANNVNGSSPAPTLIGFGLGSLAQTGLRITTKNCYLHGYGGNGSGGGDTASYLFNSSSAGIVFRDNAISVSDGVGGGMLSTAPYTIITGNTLQPGTWTDCGITINSAPSVGNIISNNIIYGINICVESASRSLITGNIIYVKPGSSTIPGISLASVGDDMVISNNSILDVPNGTNGINFYTATPTNTLTILNNHIQHTGSYANPGGIGLGTGPFPSGYNVQAEGFVGYSATTSYHVSCAGVPTSSATLFLKLDFANCTSTAQDAATQIYPTAGIARLIKGFTATGGTAAINDTVITLVQLSTPVASCTILAGQTTCSQATTGLVTSATDGPFSVKVVTGVGETGLNGIFVNWEM